jgi:hypothetical protein
VDLDRHRGHRACAHRLLCRESSSGPDGKYTPEECAGLLLVANNNGNSAWEQGNAANEYDEHCR